MTSPNFYCFDCMPKERDGKKLHDLRPISGKDGMHYQICPYSGAWRTRENGYAASYQQMVVPKSFLFLC